MKDFVKKYQNQRLFTNYNIIILSMVFALVINFVFIDGTQTGQNLKTSVLNTNQGTSESDISISKVDNEFIINLNKNVNQVSTLSFSLSYNPENINISNLESNFGNVTNISNQPGMSLIMLTIDSPVNLKKGDKIIKLNINKKGTNVENINVMNAIFKDINGGEFLLSTSGITF